MKILIIDDEKSIRTLLSKILAGDGVTVSDAPSGQEGLEKIRTEKYALLICDVRMPGIDGISVLRQAKKIDPEIEVIMISGFGTAETIVQSLKINAFDFIDKPFNNDEIKTAVNKALKSYLLKKTLSKLKTNIRNAPYDVPDPVIVLNTKKEIIAWNKAAESTLGYESAKIMGKPIDFLFSYNREIPGPGFWSELEEKGVVRDFITKCFTHQSEIIYVVMTAFFIENEGIVIHLRKSRLIVY